MRDVTVRRDNDRAASQFLRPVAVRIEERNGRVVEVVEDGSAHVSAIEEPLRQSLQGLFALWKSSRSQEGAISEEETRQSFLRIVGEVVSSR